MRISRKSWHYRFMNYFWDDGSIPKNLCGYFWSLVFAVLVTTIFGAGWFIFSPIVRCTAWFFGRRPKKVFTGFFEETTYYAYKEDLYRKGHGKYRIALWEMVFGVLGAFLSGYFLMYVITLYPKTVLVVAGTIVGGTSLIMGLIFLFSRISKNGFWKITWKYLKTKKQRACLVIEFVDD